LARKLINTVRLLLYEDRVAIGAVDRQTYIYCIFQKDKLDSLLDYKKVSIIELGCGGAMASSIRKNTSSKTERIYEVRIELYGFDTGSGLPKPREYRDIPHHFKDSLYKVDIDAVQRKLKLAKFVIGDVKDAQRFLNNIIQRRLDRLQGLDYYSSTFDSFTILMLNQFIFYLEYLCISMTT
jgi:hypothetical protein